MERHTRLISVVLLALPPLASAQGSYELRADWTARIGPAWREAAPYRVAVCPGGTSYLTDTLGRVVTLSPLGNLVTDDSYVEAEGAHATACGPLDQLVTAAKSTLRVAQRATEGRLQFGPAIDLDFHPADIAVAKDGSLFILGRGEHGVHHFVHRLATNGQTVAELAPLDAFREPQLSDRELSHDLVSGSLLLDESQDRVAILSGARYELHEFTLAGAPLAKRARQDPSWRAVQPLTNGERRDSTEQVLKAVRLQNRSVAVQLLRVQELAPGRVRTESYLEVLDVDLSRPVRVSLSGFGILVGADNNDGLYFNSSTAQAGLSVKRARLVGRAQSK